MSIKIPIGIEDFAELREENYYYIDKTAFIRDLLNRQFKANLVTRPRRFGKSLTMSMLEDFFDIRRDSRKHFEGLEISKETSLCEEWRNQWPVVALKNGTTSYTDMGVKINKSRHLDGAKGAGI